MEPEQENEGKKLTREEFDRITAELTTLIGDKLRDHEDGDAERRGFPGSRPGGALISTP
jgi:hypothetical protein